MQKKLIIEYYNLSIPPKSKGRLFKEKKSFLRGPYQRDRDDNSFYSF